MMNNLLKKLSDNTMLTSIKQEADKILNLFSNKFIAIRKTKSFKITAAVLAMLLLGGYILHLYNHARKFPDTQRVVCSMNERVAFGKNLIEIWTSEESSISANGYFITLSNARVVSFDELVRQYELEAIDVIAVNEGEIPNNMLLIDAFLENESCEKNWDSSIFIYDMLLFGYDWYSFNNFAVSMFLNSQLEDARYAATPVGSQTNFTLVYEIDDGMTLEDLKKEDMWVHLTVSPQQLDVKIEL